jgi:hypothetical protein
MTGVSRIDDFKKELEAKFSHHTRFRRWDAFLHQALIIVAALSGCASLIAGLYFRNGAAAGAIGIVPSACTLLIQNLHCVRAQNWHDKMAMEVGGLRKQLLFEIASPTDADIAKLSKKLRELEARMTDEWAKATIAQAPSLELRAR